MFCHALHGRHTKLETKFLRNFKCACRLASFLIPFGEKEGAGLKKLQLVPIGGLSPKNKFGLGSMLRTEVMALQSPANRKREGVGLKKLHLVPIGGLSPKNKFGLGSMLRTGVMTV